MTLLKPAGLLGCHPQHVHGLQVWHESSGGGGGAGRALLGEGRWCMERVEVENRIKGIR